VGESLYTNPWVEGVSPSNPLRSVLLPLPIGPMTKQNWCRSKLKVASETAGSSAASQPKLACCVAIIERLDLSDSNGTRICSSMFVVEIVDPELSGLDNGRR
jgi:hypothetical protein